MLPLVHVGDLALVPRGATDESFAPYGRILGPGQRLALGATGGTLVALDAVEPGPRRATHMQRYPEARRLLLPLGPGSLLVIVLPPGERPGGPPSAFLCPAGHGLLLKQGVWHAGPLPLEPMHLCEVLETRGPVDRMDRRSVRDLVGAEGVRVTLAEEAGGRPTRFHLGQPNSVLLDEALAGRWRVALLELSDLHIDDVLGVRGNSLLAALDRWARGGEEPPLAYDAERIGEQVLVRPGAAGEASPDPTSQRGGTEGRPLLSDRDGPLAGPTGAAQRARVSAHTRRALVVVLREAATDRTAADGLLDELSRDVIEVCGGVESARLVL